jgi:ABC-2 type transport system permease protein
MRLAAYSAFTAIAFQSRLAYRNQVWASAFGDLVGVFARIAIWMAAFAGASSVGGVTLPEMVTYSILAWQLLYWDFSRLLHEVGAAIRTGDVAVYLLKPLHYPGYLLSSHLGHFAFDFVTTVLPSWLTLFCLASACGIIAFWLMTAFSLEWFLMAIMSLVSGAVIPLWYMPPPLAAAIAYLPFAWVSYYPAAVYLGKLDVTQTWLHLGIGLLWLAALGTLVLLLWSKARHRLIVQGG